LEYLLQQLNYCSWQNEMIERYFAGYSRYIMEEYDQLFCSERGKVSEDVLGRVSKWLGVAADFKNQVAFQKQSSLPLEDTIENYGEIANALIGTKFEHCLNDELLYSS
jgi:hypothetical protein